MRSTLFRIPDISIIFYRPPAYAGRLTDTRLSGDILKYLKDPKLHPDRLSAKVVESVVSRFLGILHIVVQVNDASRQIEIVKTEISQVS